ncbi:MAG: fibronectin type III domain-containing protein, partial [Planctomycetota bacterium]
MASSTRLLWAGLAALAASTPGATQEPGGEKYPQPAAAQEAAWRSSAPWRRFLRAEGGEWSVRWSASTGTPRAIWGSGIELEGWRENSLSEARRHASALLEAHRELLGLGASELREDTGARMHRVWTLTYRQHFRGLEVVGGRADVRVHMRGRVPMFGSTVFSIPEDFDTTPTLTADAAWLSAWQALGEAPSLASQPRAPAAPRLVIYGDVHAATPQTPRLAYEVALSNVDASGQGSIGRSYVDARSAEVLAFVDDKHRCAVPGCSLMPRGAPPPRPAPVPTTVTVLGWTRTGADASSPLANVPMPGLEVDVPSQGTKVTDANGQFVVDLTTPVTVSISALEGRHHDVITGLAAPTGSWTVTPGVAATIQLLSAGASTNEAAHTTASWWIDRSNEWARSVLGNTPELDVLSDVDVSVNQVGPCSAFYTNNALSFHRAGGLCTNTAFSTVVAHEWGHGLDDRYGGVSQTDGLSEGWADIVGCYLLDTPIIASGLQTPGVGIRDGNNATQYPCVACPVHLAGESWMGFAWKLRDRLEGSLGSRAQAIATSNAIVVGSIVADADDQQAAVLEVFVADDDDGDLSNGTPNSADLAWACDQHALPYPGQTLVPNDDCAAAIPVVAGVNGPFTNVGALGSAPPWPCTAGAADVWFSVDVAAAGALTVTTCGHASWDTTLQLFGGSCGSLTSLDCNDDSCGGLRSTVTATVTPGTYLVRVGGFSGAAGPFNLEVTVPAPPPAAPTGLVATAGGATTVQLTWNDNSTNETGFVLERTTGVGSFAPVATLGANVTSFVDSGLLPGLVYTYRVAASSPAGMSSYSNAASAATAQLLTPTAPTALTATSIAADAVALAWSDNSANEDEFYVERSADGVHFALIALLGADSTTYLDPGLALGATFSYRVAAGNLAGPSAYSNVAAATTGALHPPAAPTALGASASGPHAIDLSWTDNAADEAGFSIERTPSGELRWSQVAVAPTDTTTFRDEGLRPDQAYEYRVRAFAGLRASAASNVAADTTAPLPSTTQASTGALAGAGAVLAGFPFASLDDGQAAQVQEQLSAGRPQARYSYLSHTYVLPVPSGGLLTLEANAWHTPSADNDHFAVEWSDDNLTFEPAFVVQATADGTTYTTPLPASVSGDLYVRVVDTDRSPGATSLDTVFVDWLAVRATTLATAGAPATPRGACAAAVGGAIDVAWTDEATDETRFELERSADGVAFSLLAVLPPDTEAFTDPAPTGATSWTYRVRAVGAAGASAWSSSGAVPAPGAPVADPGAAGAPAAPAPGHGPVRAPPPAPRAGARR